MGKMIMLVALTAIVLGCGGAARTGDAKAAADGNNAFAFDLYARLAAQDGNLFLSPYSISTALAMTYAGARGDTETQMAQVLHFGKNEKATHQALGKLVSDLNAAGKAGHYQLSVANALWMQNDHKFLADYTNLVQGCYTAGLNPVDFKTQTEATRQAINTWVEKETRDKIKELIKQGVLTGDTRLVLTNAIYFKGDWADKFDKDATKDAPFTLLDGKKLDVPLMNKTAKFKYAENDSAQMLEMSYVKDELSMLVFLPKKLDGLKDLEKALTAKTAAEWTQRMWKREVIVSMPKFKMTREFQLNGVLSAMGMTDAFIDGKADFSGMDGTRYLSISAVIHKAFVDVNEEGTEAAAATALIAKNGEEPRVFRADHPFIFFIRDNATGSILFLGRVMDPKQ